MLAKVGPEFTSELEENNSISFLDIKFRGVKVVFLQLLIVR